MRLSYGACAVRQCTVMAPLREVLCRYVVVFVDAFLSNNPYTCCEATNFVTTRFIYTVTAWKHHRILFSVELLMYFRKANISTVVKLAVFSLTSCKHGLFSDIFVEYIFKYL